MKKKVCVVTADFGNHIKNFNPIIPKQNEPLTQALKNKGWIDKNIEEGIINSFYYKGLFKENLKLENETNNGIYSDGHINPLGHEIFANAIIECISIND